MPAQDIASDHSVMRGLWICDGEVQLRNDLPRPCPKPGEALIRVRRAGICATDLQLVRGYAPFRGVLGHEFVGQVVEGPPKLDGRRVVGEINVACDCCSRCVANDPNHCLKRRVFGIRGLDGVFAEYAVLPVRNLHLVPDSQGRL